MSRQPLESIEELGFQHKAYVTARILDYSTQPARERVEYGWLRILDFSRNAIYLMIGDRPIKVEGVESIEEILLPTSGGQFISPAKTLTWGLVAFLLYTYTILAAIGFLPLPHPAYLISAWVIVMSLFYVFKNTPSYEILLEHKSYEKSLDPRIIFEVCVPAVSLRYGFVRQRLKLIEAQISKLKKWAKKAAVFDESAGAAYNRLDMLLASLEKEIKEELERVRKEKSSLAVEHSVLKQAFEEQKSSLDTVVDIDMDQRISETLRRYGVLNVSYRPAQFDRRLLYVIVGLIIGVIIIAVVFSGGA